MPSPEAEAGKREAAMKSCGYCGRDDDDSAATCQECGTPFLDGQPHPAEPSWGLPAIPPILGVVAGGLAVVSIFTGIVVATRHALPAVYLLALLFLPWLLVLVVGTTCLTLYAGTVCCRTQMHRVVFTFAVIGLLLAEWGTFFSDDHGLGNHGSPGTVYGASALLVLAGALTLAWIARRNRPPQPPGVPSIVPPKGGPATPAVNSAGTKQPPSRT